MKPVLVYGLHSSRDNSIRYIGQTVQRLSDRLKQHRSYAKKKQTGVHKWMNREMQEGFEILIVSLVTDAIWNVTEVDLIAQYKQSGNRLLNHTMGGEGTVGFSHSGRKRPDLAERNRMNAGKPTGRQMSEENKAKLIASIKGQKRPWVSERNRNDKVWTGRKHTEETKRKMSEAAKGAKSQEQREKQSLAMKKLWSEGRYAK